MITYLTVSTYAIWSFPREQFRCWRDDAREREVLLPVWKKVVVLSLARNLRSANSGGEKMQRIKNLAW